MVRASQPRARSARSFMAYMEGEDCLVNLAGDYAYMTSAYYASQDMEGGDRAIHPNCRETLDAYIVPLFLEKARLAGLPTPSYYVTNDYFEPPVIVDSVNPFMSRYSIVRSPSTQERVARSLTRNYTYAISCQVLPEGARVSHFRAVLGWSLSARHRSLASQVWSVFGMPLAEVRVITLESGEVLLSAMAPLPFKDLKPRERQHLERVVRWLT